MKKDFEGFRVILQLEGENKISGSNLFALLENILRYGSISRAAAEEGVSYRYAWGLLRKAEIALDLQLVEKQAGGHAGGGAVLTEEGHRMLQQYRGFKKGVDSHLSQFLREKDKGEENPPDSGRHLLLASTMEPVEAGLLDVLEHAFYQDSNILVRHVAAGSGRALDIARGGRVDLALTHAPELEASFMEQGFGVEQVGIMANDFVLAGPPGDPAGVQRFKNFDGAIALAFEEIFKTQAPFVSRGDESGTHLREQKIWQEAGIEPGGAWYLLCPGIAGNLGTLRLAAEKKAYALVDRATLLLSGTQGELEALMYKEGDPLLKNIFTLTLVNPERFPAVKHQDASLFVHWLKEGKGRSIISAFGLETYGTPLFSVI